MFAVYLVNLARILFLTPVCFFLPVLLVERGLSGWQLGVIVSVGTATGLAGSLLFGVWADRVLPRLLLGLGLCLSAAWLVGLAFAVGTTPSFSAFLALSVLGALASRLADAALAAAIMKTVEPTGKGLAFGGYCASGALAVGTGLAVMGVAFRSLGIEPALFLCAAFFALMIPLSLLLPRVELRKVPIRAYIEDLSRREVAVFALLVLLFCSHWGAEMTVYPQFLTERFHFDKGQLGLFMGPPVLLLAVSACLCGILLDRGVRPRLFLFWGVLLNGVGSVGISCSHTVGWAYFWRVVHEVGDGAFGIFFLAGISTFFAVQRIGGNAGSMGFVTVVGSLLGSFVYAPMGAAWGNALPNGLSGVVSIATGLAVLALYWDAPAAEASQSPAGA